MTPQDCKRWKWEWEGKSSVMRVSMDRNEENEKNESKKRIESGR